jgi:Protein of unknown function (DUF4242)
VNPASGSRDDRPPPATGGANRPSWTTVYLAFGLPAGNVPGGLAEIQLALAEAARTMTCAGHPVRYLNGMYMPAQTRLLCVFAAENEEAVRATAELVQLPFVQISAIRDRWDHGPDPAGGEPGR